MGGGDILFLVYGGGENCRKFCMTRHCVYVNPVVNVRNQNKFREKLKNNIFPADDISEELVKQVYNYKTGKLYE